MGSLSLLQGIFLTQQSNTGLPHCRWILCQLSHKRSPRILEWVAYPFFRRSSRPRNQTRVSCIAGGFFTNQAVREAPTMRVLSLKWESGGHREPSCALADGEQVCTASLLWPLFQIFINTSIYITQACGFCDIFLKQAVHTFVFRQVVSICLGFHGSWIFMASLYC